ncbi:hypothetical protein [Streptomyces sp. NPDC001876]|uniref:hypothetical protein n=1 Tax=Streptomyces sp. NPDC001876 TaxID=3154402 RepID=UPI00331E4162
MSGSAGGQMDERKTKAVFAVGVGAICGLIAAFWQLARTGSVDQAVATGGTVFVAVVGVAFLVLAYLKSD